MTFFKWVLACLLVSTGLISGCGMGLCVGASSGCSRSAASFEVLEQDFGAHLVGATGESALSLHNTSSQAIQILATLEMPVAFAYKGGAYPGKGGTCAATLAPGERCTLALEFQPATEGRYVDDLVLSYRAAGRTRTSHVRLRGVGRVGRALSSKARHNRG